MSNRQFQQSNFSHMAQIYDQLRNENANLSLISRDWLKFYQQNSKKALCELLNLILTSCGLKRDMVKLQNLENDTTENLLNLIHEKADHNEDYPLISKQKIFKKFYQNYQMFWINLITEASEELYDGFMMSFIMDWLTNLCFSKFRPIRHTCTAAILSIAQALADILLREKHDLERIQTFINSEEQQGNTPRLESLRAQEKEIEMRIETLYSVLQTIFEEVLGYRYKDVMYEIRALCIQSMGNLAIKHKEQYLNKKVLKCLGLMIYDKQADVREHTLSTILQMYINFPHAMQEFTNKNKLRLVEICHDIENKCCIKALKICTVLANQGALDKEEIDMLACLLWVESDELRLGACEFVCEAIFQGQLPGQTEEHEGERLEQGRFWVDENAVITLVDFFIEYADAEMFRVDLLVKAFWNKTSALRNLEVLCDLLRRGDDSRPNALALQPLQQNVIVRIIIAIMKMLRSQEERKSLSTVINFTGILFVNLPPMLRYYKHDKDTITLLVEILPMFELKALSSKDLKAEYQELISEMRMLFFSFDSDEIISKLCKGFSHFSTESHGFIKFANDVFNEIIDETVKELHRTVSDYQFSDNEKVLECWLTRATCIIKVQDILDIIGVPFLKDCMLLLSHYISHAIRSDNIGMRTCEILFYSHLWYFHRLTKNPDLLDDYIQLRNNVIEYISDGVSKSHLNNEFTQLAFKLTCETLMITSGQPAQGSPLLYKISDDLWDDLEYHMHKQKIQTVTPKMLNPSKAFVKSGARVENQKEDADVISQETCLLVGRITVCCPEITVSQLASSYLANYGWCQLRSIQLIIKQVLHNLKLKDSQQAGPFRDGNLLFSILKDSLMKTFNSGTYEELLKTKDLGKKFTQILGAGQMSAKQSEKFKVFIEDSITFAFTSPTNFTFLEALALFIKKNYLSAAQYGDLYERVMRDLNQCREAMAASFDNVELLLKPIVEFGNELGRQAGFDIPKQPRAGPGDQSRRRQAWVREEVPIPEQYAEVEMHVDPENPHALVVGTPIQKSAALPEEPAKAIKKSAAPEQPKAIKKSTKPEQSKAIKKSAQPEQSKAIKKQAQPDQAKGIQKSTLPDNQKAIKKSAPSTESPNEVVKKKAQVDTPIVEPTRRAIRKQIPAADSGTQVQETPSPRRRTRRQQNTENERDDILALIEQATPAVVSDGDMLKVIPGKRKRPFDDEEEVPVKAKRLVRRKK